MGEPQLSKSNRRAFLRRPTKSKVKVICRKGAMDMGPNLAKTVLDVSESGVRLLSNVPLEIGQEVTISLEGVSHMRPIVRTGKVSWAVRTAEGDCCVGISLDKYLAYQDIRHLT
jgi:hypothetical protein